MTLELGHWNVILELDSLIVLNFITSKFLIILLIVMGEILAYIGKQIRTLILVKYNYCFVLHNFVWNT